MGYNPRPFRTAQQGAWYLPPRGLDIAAWSRAVAEVCHVIGESNPLDGAQFHDDGRVTWWYPRPPAPPPPPPLRHP